MLIENRITDLDELIYICNDAKEIIIYGAGRVSYAFLQYLANRNVLNKVFCIMVSEKKYNPDNILGVPVCTRMEVGTRKNATLIIATFEKVQEEICASLQNDDYKQVKFLGNIVYAHLRGENQDLSVDIIQNTQWIMNDLREIKMEMLREIKMEILRSRTELIPKINWLRDRLSTVDTKVYRIEKCINYNVSHYDEILSSQQYEHELKYWYKRMTGRELNLDDPQTYNEKIQWTKLYGVTPLMTKLTDKYAVRQWVADKIGADYLVPLLGVWERFDDIDFEGLPETFVLKCNHGCEWNEIVTNKSNLDMQKVKRKFDFWMQSNFAFWGGLQLQYKDIKPRIIAEEYLCCEVDCDNEKTSDLPDYKFFCFDGKVYASYVMVDYQMDHSKGRMGFFDRDFNLLPYYRKAFGRIEEQLPKPAKYDEMVEIAEKLSEGIPHVRVDLYYVDNKIYFGEMTFTQANGVGQFEPEEFDEILGRQWNLKK